jgi:hypothetical protein
MSEDLTGVTPIATRIERKEMDEYSHDVAAALEEALPEDVKFALFLYRRDEAGSVKYISNGSLDDANAIVERWKQKVFAGVNDTSWTAAAEVRRLRMYLVNSEITKCDDDPSAIVSAAINRIREIKARYREDVPPGRRIL